MAKKKGGDVRGPIVLACTECKERTYRPQKAAVTTRIGWN